MKNSPTPGQIRHAVAQLCPEVSARWSASSGLEDEDTLWQEMACCLLSSQVSYEMAQAATKALTNSGLLRANVRNADDLAHAMEQRLSLPVEVNGAQRRYRFPRAKARQLAATRLAVHRQFGSLRRLRQSLPDPQQARAWLVENAPGIGPKQASMYLRNAHRTVDLAVLDRHVLFYMDSAGLGLPRATDLSRLQSYQRWESTLADHASDFGYNVGLFDLAVWVVMRVARRPDGEAAQ